jgi:hypothetical protein
VLRKLLRREPARLFLGTIAVAPRRDFLRHLEDLPLLAPAPLERALHARLVELICVPAVSSADAVRPSDLAFDVVVQGYQFGGSADVALGLHGFSMFWRPKVRVAARLFYAQSNKTKTTFTVTERMPWSAYMSRMLSWKVLLGLARLSHRSDLERLLESASQKLLDKVHRGAAS